jgi:anti-sigma regulatory factor (Ser/Thr protein kinase)
VEGHLRIDADLRQLAELRAFVRAQAAAASVQRDCCDDLVQVVDEAATNVITHGYRGNPGWLDVRVTVEADRFVVILADGAPSFDPTTVAEPDLGIPPMARTPGGMGVHLIRAATDAITYRPRPGGGNILTMTRSCGPRREEG